jgi:hypothetical protein
VLVIGRVERDPWRPEEPVLRPCPPPRAGAVFTGKRRFLSVPDLFLIVHGDEEKARRRLFRSHVRWLAVAAFLVGGGLIVALVGLAARLDPDLVNGLLAGRPLP